MSISESVRARINRYSTSRLEALTDGVFAIAMTILILDINIDDFGTITTDAQLWQAILKIVPSLTSFVISFLLLGSMWAVHTRQFEYIEKTDRHMTTLNTVRLLFVVIVPLTTSITGAYSDLVLARVLLPINFLLIAALSYWEWTYAANPKQGYFGTTPQGLLDYSRTRNKAVIIMSTLVVMLSVFIGQFAFILFMLLPVLSRNKSVRPQENN